MKRFLTLIVFIFLTFNCFTESIIVDNSLCVNMGETYVAVEVTNLQITMNAKYDEKKNLISPEKVLYKAPDATYSQKIVLGCDWYENYSDFRFLNSTALFFIKYYPENDKQFHFDTSEFSIKYDSIKILEYIDYRDEWAQYGKSVNKATDMKIYNPAFDILIRK